MAHKSGYPGVSKRKMQAARAKAMKKHVSMMKKESC